MNNEFSDLPIVYWMWVDDGCPFRRDVDGVSGQWDWCMPGAPIGHMVLADWE